MKTVLIDDRVIGPGHPCFIIAEAGVNHNGDPALALRMVDEAVRAGADAVKFQTYKTDQVYTAHTPKATYMLATTQSKETIVDMARKLELPFEAFKTLLAHCRKKNILFLSSPFDEESASFLASLDTGALKIPSGELTNLPYLDHVARLGLPLIVSTGMAKLGEVEEAMDRFHLAGNSDILLFHCVSNYPANPADANLRAMHTLAQAFGCPVGFSDHTPGIEVALAAVALGACMIEKHFTLDKHLPGPDHQASLDPTELAELVRGIRRVESALGDGAKRPAAAEANTAEVARKSLVAARDIPAHAVLTDAMIAVKRPGTGLPSSLRPHLLGRAVKHAMAAGTLFTLEMVQ